MKFLKSFGSVAVDKSVVAVSSYVSYSTDPRFEVSVCATLSTSLWVAVRVKRRQKPIYPSASEKNPTPRPESSQYLNEGRHTNALYSYLRYYYSLVVCSVVCAGKDLQSNICETL